MWNTYRSLSRVEKLLGVAVVLMLLLLWAIISYMEVVEVAKLPSPFDVIRAFSRLVWDADKQNSLLLEATLWSIGRIFIAAILVMIVGIPIGVLMGASPYVNASLSPLFDPFRAAPIAALLPLFVIWLGIGEAMKITFLFVSAIVYLIPMVRDAVSAVPRPYWTSSRDLGATEWEIIRLTLVPLAMPRIFDAIISSIAILWTYITIAEYVNATHGLGQLIQTARRFSAMDQVLVGIFTIIGLALISCKLMEKAKKRLFPWEGTE